MPCGPENFSVILTDNGVCYTTAFTTDEEGILRAHDTGTQINSMIITEK